MRSAPLHRRLAPRRAALVGGALLLLLTGVVGVAHAAAGGDDPGGPPGACGWLESDPPQPAPCPADPVGGGSSGDADGPVADGPAGGDLRVDGSVGSAPAGDDPLSYWTPDRMAGAEPLPMDAPEPGAR